MRHLLRALLTILFFLIYPAASLATETAAATQLKPAPRSRCPVVHPTDAAIEWDCVRLGREDTLESLFGDAWTDVARFNRIDRRHAQPYTYIKVPKRIEDIKDFSPMDGVYPEALDIPKLIIIDLSEQFLGAYDHGNLVFSAPVATGESRNRTPAGRFRITAFSRAHSSSKYTIEKTDTPYPMNYALRFYVDRYGVSYWIHGRDIPGRPASHGCVGLYDEEMQKEYYRSPKDPVLNDAKRLYEWAIGETPDNGNFHTIEDGPVTLITGKIPGSPPKDAVPKNQPF